MSNRKHLPIDKQPNYLSPRIETIYELWLLNDEGGWNREVLPPMSIPELIERFKQQCRVMPNCPCKLMRISEVGGN